MNKIKKYISLLILFISSVLFLNYLTILMIKDFKRINFTQTAYFTNSKKIKKEVIILGNSTSKNINIQNLKLPTINASTDANSGFEYLNDYKYLQHHLSKEHQAIIFFTPWTFTREYYVHSTKSFLLNLPERISLYKSIKDYIFPIPFSLNFYSFINQYITQKKSSKVSFVKEHNYKNLKNFQQSKKLKEIGKSPSKLDLDAIDKISSMGADITLVIPPFHSSFRKQMNELFKKFNLKYKILNYMDLIKTNEDNYFYNISHLNSRGLKILEKKLNEDINQLLKK